MAPAERAQGFEVLLSAAGFKAVPAKTPDQMKELETLPPLDVTRLTDSEGHGQYAYADPYYCKCVFRGDDAAYRSLNEIQRENELIEKKLEESHGNLNTGKPM